MKDLLIKKEAFRWSYLKKGSRVLNICTRLLVLALGVMMSTSTALANPTGGNVVGGSATITNTPSELQINQASQRALIEWNSFDIAAGETTRFIQPNANAVALNRVVNSQQLSTINGNLIANGRVMVINPNGVLIGSHGNVDTAGFVASTADIGNNAFMNGAGPLNFNIAGRANASVVNEGTITVADEGLVALAGPAVRNDGVIQGNLSKIQLGAADTYGIDLYGDGLINLAVDTSQGARAISAQNNGSLIADGGAVLMTAAAASGVVNSAINNTGVVQAHGFAEHNGEIVLTGEDANISVSGTLDASGANGGGTIKVGGDYQGGGTLAHAKSVNIASGATLNASATDNGNGGTVIVWADGTNDVHGTLAAKGGANGGDGGLVETSTQGHLNIRGAMIDTSAAHGTTGNWLLDPRDVVIRGGSADGTDSDGSSTDLAGAGTAYDTAPDAFTIYESEIEGTNSNITIQATRSITTVAGGDNTVTLANGRSLTIQAESTLVSEWVGNVNVDLSNLAFVTSGAGGIKVSGATASGTANVKVGQLTTDQGKIEIYNQQGNIQAEGDLTTLGGGITIIGGNVSTKNMTINAPALSQQAAELLVLADGTLNVDGNVTVINEDHGSPTHSVATAVLAARNDANISGTITVTATDFEQNYLGAAATILVGSVDGNVTIDGPIVATSTANKSGTGGDGPTVATSVTVRADNGSVTLGGPVTVAATSTSSTDATAATDATLNVEANDIKIVGDVNVNAQTVYTEISENSITSNTNATANIVASNDVTVGNVYVNANGVIPVATLLRFLSTSSAYNNTIGYYDYDANGNPMTGTIIWTGAQNLAADATVVIPRGPSTSTGLFLLSDGATQNAGLTNGQMVTFQNVDGVWQAYADGSSTPLVVAASGQGPFFTDSSLNPDQIVHASSTAESNGWNIGWEDLQYSSDDDFNDVIMRATPRVNNNNVTATLNIKTDAAGTGVVTAGNLESNASTQGTGVANATLDVYSSGVMVANGTMTSSADGATADAPYVGFDINNTVTSGASQANQTISSLHLIDVVADGQTSVYGDANPTLTYTATFAYPAASGVSTAGFLTGGLTRDAGQNVGSYAINQGTLTVADAGSLPIAGRYAINYTGDTLDITKATLTIAATSDTRTYDGTTNSSVGPVVTGLKYSDSVADLSQSFDSRNAGSRTLSVNGGYTINDSNGGGNYNVVTTTAAGTINKANLTVTAADDSKTYDGTTASTGVGTATGLVGGDTLTGLTQVFDSRNAGSRTLIVTGYTLNDGNGGNNYNVTTATGSGTINKATLTIVATGDTKVFDGTTTSTATPTATGLATGDTLTDLTEVFDSPDVGQRTLIVSGYTLTDGNGGGNYNVVTTTAAGSITGTPALIVAGNAPNADFGRLDRPIISVADKVINFDDAFEPRETLTMNADISIKGGNSSASAGTDLANIEPAAGGDDSDPKKKKKNVANTASAEALADIEPAAGGTSNPAAAHNASFVCADPFFDGKNCTAQ